MSCTLTVNFLTPGYNNGSDVGSFDVPDGSYTNAYKVVVGGPPSNTYELRVDGSSGTIALATYSPGAIQVTIASSSNSCPVPINAFDCINGSCINKNVYSTPGLYNSLSNCEIACGTGCSGKCVSNADWAQIESLSNQIMNKNCS